MSEGSEVLVNAVIYQFPLEKAEEAANLLAALRDLSREEAGCRRFDVSRCIDMPDVFVLYEQWDDRAALERHYATEHFKQLGANGIRQLANARTAHICKTL